MRTNRLVERSPLRTFDPRAKLAFSLIIALTVLFWGVRLYVSFIILLLFLGSTGLAMAYADVLRRSVPLLVTLFAVDYFFIGFTFAIDVSVKFLILIGSFIALTYTTTPEELSRGLEKLRIPYRICFAIALAFQQLGIMATELRMIRDAQKVRGIDFTLSAKRLRRFLQSMSGLIIPAIMLTVKRSWEINESIHTRGFNSPLRRSYYELQFHVRDVLLVAVSAGALLAASMLSW